MARRPFKKKGNDENEPSDGRSRGKKGRKDLGGLTDEELRELMAIKKMEIEAIDKRLTQIGENDGAEEEINGFSNADDGEDMPESGSERGGNGPSGIEKASANMEGREDLLNLERIRKEEETVLSKALAEERDKLEELRRIAELEDREVAIHEKALKLAREEKELRRRLETHGDFKDIDEMEKYVDGWQDFLKRRERDIARRKDDLLALDKTLSERTERLDERAKRLDEKQKEIQQWLGVRKKEKKGNEVMRKAVDKKDARKKGRKRKGR